MVTGDEGSLFVLRGDEQGPLIGLRRQPEQEVDAAVGLTFGGPPDMLGAIPRSDGAGGLVCADHGRGDAGPAEAPHQRQRDVPCT
jgi:hypothetical protein